MCRSAIFSPQCCATKSGSVFSKNPLVRRTLPRTGGRFPPMLKAPALAPSVQASGKPSKESKPYQVTSATSSAKWLIESPL